MVRVRVGQVVAAAAPASLRRAVAARASPRRRAARSSRRISLLGLLGSEAECHLPATGVTLR
eukprot:9691007-Alexandrium_andersonii.AAC.1